MFIKKIKGSCTFHFCKTYIGLYGESLSRNRENLNQQKWRCIYIAIALYDRNIRVFRIPKISRICCSDIFKGQPYSQNH